MMTMVMIAFVMKMISQEVRAILNTIVKGMYFSAIDLCCAPYRKHVCKKTVFVVRIMVGNGDP